MAGLGRRTHYRKHLTDSVLFDLPEPSPSERLARVVATRGSNQFEILLADGNISPSGDAVATTTSRKREPQLAILPTKFRKLVWVKRNDYVIVETGQQHEDDAAVAADEDDALGHTATNRKEESTTAAAGGTGGGIRYMISHILYKDQVKHLKSNGLWPDGDPEFANEASEQQHGAQYISRQDDGDDDGALANENESESENEADHEGDDDDGIVYENDADLFVNTNRVAALKIDDSSSSDDDD